MSVKFGVFVPQGWRLDLNEIADPVEQYEAMTTVARVADEGGWDSIWVYDHFHTVPTTELATTFECWTITATLARDTSRVRVGQMVTCNGYRNPALLAKIASTVDVASHGRLNMGIGAGWKEDEWLAYGYGFPDAPERLAMLSESVEIIHRMWTEDYPVFHGKHYSIDRAVNCPKGVQQPHPPLWIGGGGENVTLRIVAKWADACNFGYGDPEVLKHKLGVLREHCDRQGTDFARIIKSTSIRLHLVDNEANADRETAAARGNESLEEYRKQVFVATTDQVVERLHELVEVGADYFIFYLPRLAYDQEPMRRFAREIIPKFAG
jgi:F420-dependent oxidoreductase-like protein